MQKCHRLLFHRQDEANGKQDGTDGKFVGHNGCVKTFACPNFSPRQQLQPRILSLHPFESLPQRIKKNRRKTPSSLKKADYSTNLLPTATESLRSFSASVLNHSIYLCSSFSASCVSYLSTSSRNMFISSCMISFRFSHFQIYDNDLAIRV